MWQLKVIVGDILDIMNVSWLLETLLVLAGISTKGSFQIELSRILIFGRGRMYSNNRVGVESVVTLPVTVARILTIYW